MVSSYKKFTKDVGLVAVGNIVSRLSGLILVPILTKTLGASDYGIWSLIMGMVPLLMPLALLQLGFAMTRFLAAEKDKKKISKGFSSIFAAASFTSFVLSLLIFIFAEPIAVAVLGNSDAAYLIRIFSFLVLLDTLFQVIIEYFVAFRQMERYTVFTLFQTIGGTVLAGYLILSGHGLFGAIISLIVVKALIFIAGFLVVRREVGLSKPSISMLRSYLLFSLPLIPTTTFIWIVNLSDRYVIGYFMDTKNVGIYSAAYALGSIVAFFFGPIGVILLPTITNLYANNKIQELKTHLKYSIKYFLMFAIPSLFGCTILSKSLLRTLTTAEFVSAYLIVSIVSLATIFLNCSYVYSNVIILHKKTKLIGIVYAISALINTTINIILVPIIGILGAAISTLITFLIHLIVVSIISFRSFSFDLDLRFIIKSIISSGVMYLIILKLNPIGIINILTSIGLGAAIYFCTLTLLRGFTKEEYRFFGNIVKAVI